MPTSNFGISSGSEIRSELYSITESDPQVQVLLLQVKSHRSTLTQCGCCLTMHYLGDFLVGCWCHVDLIQTLGLFCESNNMVIQNLDITNFQLKSDSAIIFIGASVKNLTISNVVSSSTQGADKCQLTLCSQCSSPEGRWHIKDRPRGLSEHNNQQFTVQQQQGVL